VGGPSEPEISQKVALVDALTLPHQVFDSRDLRHTDLDAADPADQRVVGLDDVDLSAGDHGEHGLRGDIVLLEGPVEVRVAHTVGMPRRVALLDDASDRRPPSVVAPRTEEALVHSPAHEVPLEIVLLILW